MIRIKILTQSTVPQLVLLPIINSPHYKVEDLVAFYRHYEFLRIFSFTQEDLDVLLRELKSSYDFFIERICYIDMEKELLPEEKHFMTAILGALCSKRAFLLSPPSLENVQNIFKEVW